MADWLVVALAGWAVGATATAVWFARETRAARRHARIAALMAGHAVERLADAEAALGGTVLSVQLTAGGEDVLTSLRRVGYWLN